MVPCQWRRLPFGRLIMRITLIFYSAALLCAYLGCGSECLWSWLICASFLGTPVITMRQLGYTRSLKATGKMDQVHSMQWRWPFFLPLKTTTALSVRRKQPADWLGRWFGAEPPVSCHLWLPVQNSRRGRCFYRRWFKSVGRLTARSRWWIRSF